VDVAGLLRGVTVAGGHGPPHGGEGGLVVGEPVAVGFDVVVTADDGRLRAVYGFLDKAPAAG
jgi:hypothetical protein